MQLRIVATLPRSDCWCCRVANVGKTPIVPDHRPRGEGVRFGGVGLSRFRCIRLELKGCLDQQVAPKRVELNSGSGKAIAQWVKADGSLLA